MAKKPKKEDSSSVTEEEDEFQKALRALSSLKEE